MSGPSSKLDQNTANLLASSTKLFVQQRFSLIEVVTGGCCQVRNYYKILNAQTGEKVFDVREKSGNCNRLCCHPWQSMTLEFRPAGVDKESPPVMTIERQGCCKKWLCCMGCSCLAWGPCNDGERIHAGFVDHEKIGEIPTDSMIGSSAVPKCVMCHPVLHLMDGSQMEGTPYGKVEGPMCFGGCTELCCDFNFPVSKFDSPDNAGDLALITKEKPRNFKELAKEALGDADMYAIEFRDSNLTPAQKANILGSLFLIDYMFFEFDNGMFSCPNGKPVCTLFLCYCMGCLWRCNITLGDNSGNGEGGGGGGGQ